MYKIYSKNNCQYCTKAKNFLKLNNINYVEINFDESDSTIKEDFISNFPNVRSLPAVFYEGNFIGGYQELVEHAAN